MTTSTTTPTSTHLLDAAKVALRALEWIGCGHAMSERTARDVASHLEKAIKAAEATR